MKTREDVIKACLSLGDTYEDYPFHDENWTAMRHTKNKKTFAFIFARQEKIWINVKADSAAGQFWRKVFPAVVPAYHMNKTHWLSIILDGSMEEKEIIALLSDSFCLTAPKSGKENA